MSTQQTQSVVGDPPTEAARRDPTFGPSGPPGPVRRGRLTFVDNRAGPIKCPYCERVTHRGDEKMGADLIMLHHLAARHPETDVRFWPVFERQ